MAEFLNKLVVEQVDPDDNDGRGRWAVLAALFYKSDVANRIIKVPAGFQTDYASVPRLPLTYWLTGDTAHAAAVVHDWLYTSHEVPRAVADDVFREAMKVTGVPAWRATLMWVAVRLAGKGSWEK